MKNGGMKEMMPHAKHTFWPQWDENKPFALVLLLLGAFVIVYFNARITQVQKETDQIGEPIPYEHNITVEGEGKVIGTPDIATITLGVESKGDDVGAAQTSNTVIANSLIEKVKAMGVVSADVQTSNYSVYPNYQWVEESQTSEQQGWTVSQTISVKVRDLTKVSGLLSMAGSSGATSVSGPEFTIDDTSNLKAEARSKAVTDAKSKAEALAAELGVKLEGITSYSEYMNTPSPYPYYDMYAMGEGMKSAAPTIEPGSSEVDLVVSVTYKIAQ